MSEVFDVIVIGSGHNGLTTAGYLAKAGKSVLILEGESHYGGGVATREVTVPGFKHDLHSANHLTIQFNPLITRDELKLKSKYGLEYIRPVADISTIFTDGSCLISYADITRTLDSIAVFSKKDADAYNKLYKEGLEFAPLAIEGMFVPPPPFGAFVAMLDQSATGRNVLHDLQRSVWDVLNERFESDQLKIHIMRILSEHFVDPGTGGEGGTAFLYPAMLDKAGFCTPRGGSGALVDAMIRQLEDHGAVLRANSKVVKVLTSKGKAEGVRLADGTEIRARELVVGQIHPYNLPKLVDGLDDQILYEIERAEHSTFSCCTAHYALDAPPKYSHEDLNDSWCNGLTTPSLKEFMTVFYDLRKGEIPKVPSIGTMSTHKVDPTRNPAGKATFLAWRVAPFKLEDGRKWEDIRAEVEEETLDMIDSFLPGLKSNVIGKAFDTPEDIAAHTPTFQFGDVTGLSGSFAQSQSHRPTPSLGQYAVPGVENLYLAGTFMHPSVGGVTGGGRATAVKIFGDKGWDFDKVTT
jgi:phytoene dehydrogenase-like protein